MVNPTEKRFKNTDLIIHINDNVERKMTLTPDCFDSFLPATHLHSIAHFWALVT